MKKIGLVILSILFSLAFISNAYAYTQGTRTCIYNEPNMSHSSAGKSWKEYLDITFMGLGDGLPTLGNINYYKYFSDDSKEYFIKTEYDSIDYYMNWDRGITGMPTEQSYWTTAIITQKGDEVITNDDKSLICPSKLYVLEYTKEVGMPWNKKVETTYEIYACGNNYGDYNNDTCALTRDVLSEKRKTANHDGSAGKMYTLEYFTGTIISNDGQKDPTKTNVNTQYNTTETNKEKYCEEGSADYNEEECTKTKLEQNQYVNQAVEQGYTEETLQSQYQELKNKADLDFKVNGECSSILGSTAHKENPDPAYYLQFAFNLMKYVALVLLFVLTVVEFGKATASNNQDAMKKAINNTVKRLIIAVIIFFLPILIKFVLTLVGIYSADTCGIK